MNYIDGDENVYKCTFMNRKQEYMEKDKHVAGITFGKMQAFNLQLDKQEIFINILNLNTWV